MVTTLSRKGCLCLRNAPASSTSYSPDNGPAGIGAGSPLNYTVSRFEQYAPVVAGGAA
jgi:hypothetical protein